MMSNAMASTSSFSSSGEDAIRRTIDVNSNHYRVSIPETQQDFALFEEIFDVRWTAEEIISGKYKQVALQFPDELLCITVPIFQTLKKLLPPDISLYVLADTSYGSCCVDEVTAQHVNADLIVHYGYSCLSIPSRVPVLFVFPKAEINIGLAKDALIEMLSQRQDISNVIFIPDVAYAHASDVLYNELKSSQILPPNIKILYKPIPKQVLPTDQKIASQDTAHISTSCSHRRYTLPEDVPLSTCTIVYLGGESLGLTNLLMTHPDNTIISYDPSTPQLGPIIESVRTNKLLMRRYAIVQKARDADIFGILVGTLGVASYLPLISHLRDLIRRRKKKFYTLTVGKLNPAKLANFVDIECFVIVACPENSVIESKDFFRPIITPFELYLALNDEPIWPGNYVLDFERLVEMKQENLTEEQSAADQDKDPDRPVFSLTTGKYRYVKKYETEESVFIGETRPSSDMILRNNNAALTNLASNVGASFLREKTFKGLEQRLGQDMPSILKEGRSGIAKDYNEQG